MALFLPALTPALDSNGNPVASAVWEFYSKGTTTPAALVGGAQTAVSDINGVFDELNMPTPSNYRAILKSSAGNTLYEVQSATDSLFAGAVKSAVNTMGATQSGATWSFFTTGTTTPQTVYSDDTLRVRLGSIVTANSAGRFPEIHLNPAITYKAILAFNGVMQVTIDPVSVNNVGIYLDPEFAPQLPPATQWNGTAGTGFGTANPAAPTDPARTTAKPALRLITVPNQSFTDMHLVGVTAAANDSGTLFNNLGIQKVVAHYEGNRVDILAPSYKAITSANGTTRLYLGWWVNLKRTGNGETNLYFEAVPRNATMQNRVIGPYTYRPAAAVHDLSITVDSTQAEIAGSRYQSVTAAIAYARAQAAKNPLVTVTGGTEYDLQVPSFTYSGITGWLTITATTPITFTNIAGYTSDTAPSSVFQPRANAVCFRGSNVTFDFAEVSAYVQGTGARLWLDGINVTNSFGQFALWRGTMVPISTLWGEGAWITDCNMEFVHWAAVGANLVRGGNYSNIPVDLFDDALCLIGTNTANFSDLGYNSDTPVCTVQYTGASATATIERTGGQSPITASFILKENGATVATFAIESSNAAFLANTNYTIQNLVNFVNAQTGWTATLLNNSRAARTISLTGLGGNGFGATNAKSAAVTLVSNLGAHADYYQTRDSVTPLENVIIANNVGTNLDCEVLFPTGQNTTHRDFIVYNNAWDSPIGIVGESQLARGNHSHMVIVHNSWSEQRLSLRMDLSPPWNPDAYCLIANNAIKTIAWVGTPDADVTIKNNHIHAGQSAPAGSTGTTIGGTGTTLFVNAPAGNFAPAGALLTNLKTSVVLKDLNGNSRAPTAPAGAVA